MAKKSSNMRWILLAIAGLIIFTMNSGQVIPKEAVADVEGMACTVNEDCPCWGKVEDTDIAAYGIGVATCHICDADDISGDNSLPICSGKSVNDGVCDTTWCADVEEVSEWVKDNPWNWVKDNIMMALVVVGLIILALTWPKNG